MIVVLDANVLVAAFATRGLCQSVFELCLDRHTVAVSEQLIQELVAALRTKIKLPHATVAELEEYVRSTVWMVTVAPLPRPVCRDPDDDQVLALAVAAEADLIVTGDKDLLVLGRHEEVDIVTPRAFWDRQRAQ